MLHYEPIENLFQEKVHFVRPFAYNSPTYLGGINSKYLDL